MSRTLRPPKTDVREVAQASVHDGDVVLGRRVRDEVLVGLVSGRTLSHKSRLPSDDCLTGVINMLLTFCDKVFITRE